MSEDTEVGPSMAWGNHTWSGNWADLAIAPTKKQIPATVQMLVFLSIPCINKPCSPKRSTKSNVPKVENTKAIPIKKPKSPIRLMMNAFLLACTAASRVNQTPISKYEAKPTRSQQLYIMNKFLEIVKPSMAKQKRLRYIQ